MYGKVTQSLLATGLNHREVKDQLGGLHCYIYPCTSPGFTIGLLYTSLQEGMNRWLDY